MINVLLAVVLSLQVTPVDSTLVIRSANILTMVDTVPEWLELHSAVVREGRIAWMGPDSALVMPPGARVLDVPGTYLMPGLADMHAHISERMLPLFLANGVTTVRELNGNPARVELRERLARGELPGPRLVVGSPLLTGIADWPVRHVVVPDPDSARSVLRMIVAEDYDFVKIYDGLGTATYATIADLADVAGLPMTGHVPRDVGLEGVLAAGQDLEHIEKIVWATVGRLPDPERIPEIAARIAEAGIWVTTTLFSQKVLTRQGTAEFEALFERPELRYVDDGTIGWWSSLRRPGASRPFDSAGLGARLYAFQEALTRGLFEADVPLLLGTDTPNPLLVPGFSLYDEIAALVDAGIPLYRVLRIATAGAGEWLGRHRGVIQPGADADLLLLEANPLLDPTTLRRPWVVVVDGRVYRRDRLDDMLAEIDRP